MARTTTATKTAVKPTVVDAPVEQRSAAWSQLQDAIDRVQSELGINIGWKRYVCSLIVGCLVSFGAGYLAGIVLQVLAVAALIATGSVYLMYAVAICGFIVGMFAAAKAGKAAFNYIASGHIDMHFAVAKGAVVGAARWVGGLFTSNKDEVYAS